MVSKKLYIIIISLVSFFPLTSLNADNNFLLLSDSAQISLLTNSPWDKEVYAMFGHTVIRVNDPLNKMDLAFNYGTFDFNSPNFLWRFVTGETDYKLAIYDMFLYLREYDYRGVEVREQVLNLNQNEKQKIWEALLINAKPENETYRYNFLYNNCATRPRDIIEQNIDGTINYTPTNKSQTYRNLIHECVKSEPWLRFGIDLVIGGDADKIITDRQKDFLPQYLNNAYHGATIEGKDNETRSLVKSERILLNKNNVNFEEHSTNSPLIIGYILLLITMAISYYFYKKNKIILGKIFSTLIFITAGLFGSIIFFLMFFSEHPCVCPNWNLVWLHPLHLIIGSLFFVKPLTKYIYYYHFINFVALLLFLLAWVLIPQQLESAFIPYILIIEVCSGMNVLAVRRMGEQNGFLFAK